MGKIAFLALMVAVGVVFVSYDVRQPRGGTPEKESISNAQLHKDGSNDQQAAQTTALNAIAAAATKNEQESADQGKQETAVEYENIHLQRWVIGVGIVQTLALLLTLAFVANQARETKRATNVSAKALDGTINKERARISIERTYENGGLFRGYPVGDPPFAEAGINIAQDGPTNAYNVRGELKIVVSSSTDPPPIDSMWIMNIPSTIKTTSELILETAIIPNDITQEFVDRLMEEKVFLHFFGFISYEDSFGNKRETTFRYIWKYDEVTTDDGQSLDDSGWIMHGPKEDNQAT